MGRNPKEIDIEAMIDLASRGVPQTEIAEHLGVSTPTIATRIQKLQEEQGILLQYRGLRNLHLTKLQAKCLEAISDTKIKDATMIDLVRAFKILHDAETETKDGTKVHGLVAYLLQIEKEEVSGRLQQDISNDRLIEMAAKMDEERSNFDISYEIEIS